MNALGRLIDLMPRARTLGPEGCEAMAKGANARGDLKTALLWHAAACLVAYESDEAAPKGEVTP